MIIDVIKYQHLKGTAAKTFSLILSVGERMEKGHVKLYYDSCWYNSTVKSFEIRVRCTTNLKYVIDGRY